MSYEPPPPYAGGYQPTGAPPDPYGAPPSYQGYAPSLAPPAYSYAPPAYASAPPPFAGGMGATDEVRTVFVTGFPIDVKERELNNLLRFLPGYEASQMNYGKGSAQGFALFTSGAHARAACDQLQHVRFDENSSLRAEMARKNMYIKDMEPNAKRARPASGMVVTGGYGVPPSGGPVGGSGGGGGGGVSGGYSRPGSFGGPGGGGGAAAAAAARDDNPPCNTLFVGNLSDSVDENELRSLFSGSPGFRQLKLMRGPKATLGFVEFDDTGSAITAHNAQQNAMLNSSDRGPIRVQFSKNPFGRKRDVDGRVIETPNQREGIVPATGSNPGSAPYSVAGVGGAPSGDYSGQGGPQ
ncbi:hypothetical protein CHLRE_08g364700v5 [Chlamydomonas reinhardtii]|uniref:RRM domain-containing protein n=1 Tax=Chlamydomonas reinhardtii TaxID=3055 RepID=A0A2K3DGT6_CHLRE|nr:uncharacterized protein CHLRE_08g364700v5 [Chlamydomonas reinhardtii]PNW79726.1 hypothetical protein CHLRE_08g364700v5 [Chlamydomonas reinhardtii]